MLETVILRANKLRSDLALKEFPIIASSVAEKLGILIVRANVSLTGATVLGFTPGSGRWIAVAAGLELGLENKTIMHELYHALYHTARPAVGGSSAKDEAEADQFAIEVLMPRLEFSAYALLYDFEAAQLADRFGVEIPDAELRLRDLIPGDRATGIETLGQ
jgi:Zn-dependent peptidase ImmA (M78 family)